MFDAHLDLPCGASLPNRLAKSALSEQLGDERHGPSEQLIRLYQRWSGSGAGLLITGHVMVDRDALCEPANVVVEGRRHLDELRRWARSAKSGGATVVVQLDHPRLATASGAQALEILARFDRSARILMAAGFDGVQLNATRGNGRRLLVELAEQTREAIGPGKVLSVKLPATEDSLLVASALADAGVDLIEVSGGSLEFAQRLRGLAGVPLMVTGGFSTHAAMQEALASGAVDMIGLGRLMAVDPDAPSRLLAGTPQLVTSLSEKRLGTKSLDRVAETTWYTTQLWRMGRGKEPATSRPAVAGVGRYLIGGMGYTWRKLS